MRKNGSISTKPYFIDEEITVSNYTPRIVSTKNKTAKKKKSKVRPKATQNKKFLTSQLKTSRSPYRHLLDKFKNSHFSKPAKSKPSYSARGNAENRSNTPSKIFKHSVRGLSKSKPKSTSTLTRWLQRLLESHANKTRDRNVIDYFIYAIYTILADTDKTRERISS